MRRNKGMMNWHDKTAAMSTARMQGFSDAVIAIIITIMVLELKAPDEASLEGLLAAAPPFLSYLLSFSIVMVMWIGHQYLLHSIGRVDRLLLWANSNLLFWMSLVPLVAGYLGHNPAEPFAIALYSFVIGCDMGSFALLRRVLLSQLVHDRDRAIYHAAVRRNLVATAMSLLAIPLAYVMIYLSYAILVAIPLYFIKPGQWRIKWH